MIESSVSESVVLECKSVLEQRLSLLKRTGNDGDYLNDDIEQNLNVTRNASTSLPLCMP